jgi:predicted small secreted protein
MNKLLLLLVLPVVVLLTSCSSVDGACEDVTLASEQIQECQALHKRIVNAKGDILIRSELERRYQQDCIDIRYYRDERQAAICGNKHKLKEIKTSAKAESQQ